MPGSDTTIIVSDAHLSEFSSDTAATFHEFLATVPDQCNHLLINGDLFEFWFTYPSVIPRAVYPTLAALTRVAKSGVRLTVTGGNHDRWGGSFWKNEMGADYYNDPAEMKIAGRTSWVAHGHGIVELDSAGRLLHWVTGHRFTEQLFRLVHPDLAFWMVRKLSAVLAKRRYDHSIVTRAAAAQAKFAMDLLGKRTDLAMVILGHTHSQALECVDGDRWYLNPGAWAEGYRYAVINADGPELRAFSE